MAAAFPSVLVGVDKGSAELKRLSFPSVIEEYLGVKGVKQRCSILEESSHRRHPTLPTTDFVVITVEDDSHDNDLLAKQHCVSLIQVSSHSGNREVLKLDESLLMQGCGHYLVSPRLFAVDEPNNMLFVLESDVERRLVTSVKATLLKEVTSVSLRRFRLNFDRAGMISTPVEELDCQQTPFSNKFVGVKATNNEETLPLHPVALLLSPRLGGLRVITNRCAGYHLAVTKEKKEDAASACGLLMFTSDNDWQWFYPLLRNRMLSSSIPVLYFPGNWIPQFKWKKNYETLVLYGESLCGKHPSLQMFDNDMTDASVDDECAAIIQMVHHTTDREHDHKLLRAFGADNCNFELIGFHKDTLITHKKLGTVPLRVKLGRQDQFLLEKNWALQNPELLEDLSWPMELKANQRLEYHMKSVWLVTKKENEWDVTKAPLKIFPSTRQRCYGCLRCPDPKGDWSFKLCRTCLKPTASSIAEVDVHFCSRRCLKNDWHRHRTFHHATAWTQMDEDDVTKALMGVLGL